MNIAVLIIFAFVYLGMILGRLPGLAIDRTGVALLGAALLVGLECLTPDDAWRAIDVSTIILLLGLMVISAQLRLGGLYTAITHRMIAANFSPRGFLLLLIFVSAILSALLANDVVCLAVAPLLVESCCRRGWRPVPFLLALACAANVGSAATLIGNPQNMLIGQALRLSFAAYLLDGVAPAAVGCLITWAVICVQVGGDWYETPCALLVEARPLRRWQSAKGLLVLAALVTAFLVLPLPREVVVLVAMALLLMSREMHTRDMLALIDWPLLVLFGGLFIVNHALQITGLTAAGLDGLRAHGVHLRDPAWLFGTTVVLSNIVSNVPAVMLLLPAAEHPQAGAILALSSTLAGNLFIVGSIANIIVVDQAARLGVRITWAEHARVGAPVTLLTLLAAAAWLWLRSWS